MSPSFSGAVGRRRRSMLGVDIAVGAGFIAAMIALAHTARADTDIDPFQDLFGTAGINTWTTAADSSLAGSDPTLAASLDTSVDNFLAAVPVSTNFPEGDDPFSSLVWDFDQSAFDGFAEGGPFIDGGGLPVNGISDLAVGLDYTLFASGIGGNDLAIWDLLSPIASIPEASRALEFFLAIIFAGLLPW